MAVVSLLELDRIDKERLVDSRGLAFREYRRTLTPRYGRAWLDIALGYVAIAVTWMVMARVDQRFPRLFWLTGALGALVMGYWIAYVQLFLHEAVHFNLAPARKLNDLLANIFLGAMVGRDVRDYRIVHFDHHRYLGTTNDTERSYFEALSARFVLESLTGIKLLRVVAQRRRRVQSQTGAARGPSIVLLAGLAGNALVVTWALFHGQFSIAFAWCAGMGVVHPFINAVRQVLEHRSFDAQPRVDYSSRPHGALTRTFGRGPLASTLGGAGFNRHLLHHWEPQISYTRFFELESFLLDTEAGGVLRRSTTSYAAAFWRLWSQGK